MTIAYFPNEDAGARLATPQGPIDTVNGPFTMFRPGAWMAGDGNSVFLACTFVATANQVVNQGDVALIDNNFVATLAANSGGHLGVKVGTFAFGGNTGIVTTYNNFSFKFVA